MQTVNGSLTLLNIHTREPQVFWNGLKVDGVVRIHAHHDEDESRVKLYVSGASDTVVDSMLAAGINVKKVVL